MTANDDSCGNSGSDDDDDDDDDADEDNDKTTSTPAGSVELAAVLAEIATAEKGEGPPLSKNKLRKLKRKAELLAAKPARRQAERNRRKERKRARREEQQRVLDAIAAGDTSVSLPVQQPMFGAAFKNQHRHGEVVLRELLKAPDTLTAVLDCGFEADMTDRELISLETQVAHCYALITRAHKPMHLVATGLTSDCKTMDRMRRSRTNIDHWVWTVDPRPLGEVYPAGPARERVVYLCAESDTVLEELSPQDVYVIGGLVDHNRLKGACYAKATALGMRTARLPIEKLLPQAGRVRTVLTTVGVMELLVAKQTMGWKEALEAVMPPRWKRNTEDGGDGGDDDDAADAAADAESAADAEEGDNTVAADVPADGATNAAKEGVNDGAAPTEAVAAAEAAEPAA